ncbi:NAD-dependent epimerase/dehydratase family protein [Methyloradius palustris]|uniref:Oxidoreductase n=1 Tax=Methyloradius palustris TaxID=2778876 RepID=A0A8D5K1S4_9PROT|nr:NAD-dependent epimerase/dehydratase family protein [Methyloradius palustris]BCM26038.1 oxidoreductase [Methyloradius palustris]
MRVLVLGGRGFIGRHIVASLLNQGAKIIISSRKADPTSPTYVSVRMQEMTNPADWIKVVASYDVVVNSVGILRERWKETYDAVHRQAPMALAAACKSQGIRLIHISALSLSANAQSRFIRSKLSGEQALLASGADLAIVRPSLLDGEGGFGAQWIRRVARSPIYAVMKTKGVIAPLKVSDLGDAIARLCFMRQLPSNEIELGGNNVISMREYLARLRREYTSYKAYVLEVPVWMVRLSSHILDLLQLTPLSFGHVELMQGYNAPKINLLASLIGRKPAVVGIVEDRQTESKLMPTAID